MKIKFFSNPAECTYNYANLKPTRRTSGNVNRVLTFRDGTVPLPPDTLVLDPGFAIDALEFPTPPNGLGDRPD